MYRLFFEAVTFAGVGNVRNLSRSDPAKISTGVGSQTHFHAVGGSSPLVFISTIVVHSCNIQDPKMNSNGKLQKVIEGACIEGEWERLVGAIGMIVNAAEFKSQIMAGNLTFGTAYASPDYGTYIYSVFAAILIEYMPVGSSPSTNRGARRVSGPNPFSRGPGGAGGATLACHDIGVSCYIVTS
jgi:hypothetical protein